MLQLLQERRLEGAERRALLRLQVDARRQQPGEHRLDGGRVVRQQLLRRRSGKQQARIAPPLPPNPASRTMCRSSVLRNMANVLKKIAMVIERE